MPKSFCSFCVLKSKGKWEIPTLSYTQLFFSWRKRKGWGCVIDEEVAQRLWLMWCDSLSPWHGTWRNARISKAQTVVILISQHQRQYLFPSKWLGHFLRMCLAGGEWWWRIITRYFYHIHIWWDTHDLLVDGSKNLHTQRKWAANLFTYYWQCKCTFRWPCALHM